MTRQQKEQPNTQNHGTNDASEFAVNMARAAEKCQQVLQEFVARQGKDIGNTPFDPLNVTSAFMELFKHMMNDPMSVWEKQVSLWQDYMSLWQNAAQRLMGEEQAPLIQPDSKDRRFKDQAWQGKRRV
jgi:polyhydroxyalkanoate synthase subunit PhaC